MEIKLNTILNFGKYKEYKVSDILPIIKDSSEFSYVEKIIDYFQWIQDKTENHSLHKEVIDRISLNLKYKPIRKHQFNTVAEERSDYECRNNIQNTSSKRSYRPIDWRREDNMSDVFDAHGN